MTAGDCNHSGGGCVPIAKVLISQDQIAQRVADLAEQINRQYAGEELTIVGVLTGAFVFLADVMRKLAMPVRMDVVIVSSYPGDAVRSQGARLTMPPAGNLAGKHVLVVDDILDSGRTLSFLLEYIGAMKPASLRTCVLLRKDRSDLDERVDADFVGFDIPDEFVVGYGLDYDDLHRNLPDICVLAPPPQENTE